MELVNDHIREKVTAEKAYESDKGPDTVEAGG